MAVTLLSPVHPPQTPTTNFSRLDSTPSKKGKGAKACQGVKSSKIDPHTDPLTHTRTRTHRTRFRLQTIARSHCRYTSRHRHRHPHRHRPPSWPSIVSSRCAIHTYSTAFEPSPYPPTSSVYGGPNQIHQAKPDPGLETVTSPAPRPRVARGRWGTHRIWYYIEIRSRSRIQSMVAVCVRPAFRFRFSFTLAISIAIHFGYSSDAVVVVVA